MRYRGWPEVALWPEDGKPLSRRLLMHPSMRKRLQRREADETSPAGDHYLFQYITPKI
jgi:hypothetical protein